MTRCHKNRRTEAPFDTGVFIEEPPVVLSCSASSRVRPQVHLLPEGITGAPPSYRYCTRSTWSSFGCLYSWVLVEDLFSDFSILNSMVFKYFYFYIFCLLIIILIYIYWLKIPWNKYILFYFIFSSKDKCWHSEILLQNSQ